MDSICDRLVALEAFPHPSSTGPGFLKEDLVACKNNAGKYSWRSRESRWVRELQTWLIGFKFSDACSVRCNEDSTRMVAYSGVGGFQRRWEHREAQGDARRPNQSGG